MAWPKKSHSEIYGGKKIPKNLKIVIVGLPCGRYGYKKHEREALSNNHIWRRLRQEYRLDLGFPLYRDSFDLTPWLSQGIWAMPPAPGRSTGWHPTSKKERSYKRLYWNICRNHKELVFIFLGTAEYLKYGVYVNTKKHHVIVVMPRPNEVRPKSFPSLVGSKLFSRAAEYLRLSKSIWKLPFKVEARKRKRGD